MREKDNPLTPDQIQQLAAREAQLVAVQQLIERGCRCGMDMRAEQALCDALQRRLAAILQEFGGRKVTR
jgi:hypothetical protein